MPCKDVEVVTFKRHIKIENIICKPCTENHGKICWDIKPKHDSDRKIGFLNKIHASSIIDAEWSRRTREGRLLFNWSKFRLHSFNVLHDDTLQIVVGITDYKEFIGTNCNPDYIKALEYVPDRSRYLSNAIGVGGTLISSDGFLTLLLRSSTCAEEPCCLDRPGGHPEPKRIFGSLNIEDIDITQADDHLIQREITHSVLYEIQDEVNIEVESCSLPLLMGISFKNKTSGKPSLEFLIRCNLNQGEIESRYRGGGQAEANESTDIIFIHESHISQIIHNEKNAIWNSLTPCAKAALYLYFISIR